MGDPPSDVLARLHEGDPDVVFAASAAAEASDRENERWSTLIEALQKLFKNYLGR